MKTFRFQDIAIENLLKYTVNNFEEDHIDITFSSPVGSGKTIMMGRYMNELPVRLKSMGINENISFMWISPGKGKLDEQSKNKIKGISNNINCLLLSDLLTKQKLDNLDAVFTDWQKLNSDNNIAWRNGDFNGLDYILNTCNGKIILLIDEAHDTSSTEISQNIIEKINPFLTIYITATPKNIIGKNINVKVEDVISEGLIKSSVAINENSHFEKNETIIDSILKEAINKRNELQKLYGELHSDVIPLCLIQIENDSSMDRDNASSISNCERIETKLHALGIKDEEIAIWLAGKHTDNLKDIQNNDTKFLIFKEAVALGWDCPRSQILVRLRETSNIIFNIQTIGRIMRMPELSHYQNPKLNMAYIYTDDDNFEYNTSVDEEMQSRIKTEKNMSYIKEKFMAEKMNLNIPMEKNVVSFSSYVDGEILYKKLDKTLSPILKQYDYTQPITRNIVEGNISTNKFYDENFSIDSTSSVEISAKDISERFYYYIKKLYNKFNISNYLYTIAEYQNISRDNFRKLFLLHREQLALIINNAINEYETENFKTIIEKNYILPDNSYFIRYKEDVSENNYLYDKLPDFQYLYEKDLIQEPEYKFSKYLLGNPNIKLWLKNGDVGDEYFSILYKKKDQYTNISETSGFYPDYICLTNDNKLLLLETKGFNDIDKNTSQKFNAIKPYLDKYRHNLTVFDDVLFSVVRYIEDVPYILINTDTYVANMAESNYWKPLDQIINNQ